MPTGGKGGSSSSSDVTITADGSSFGTVDIVGLDDVNVTATVNVPDPITTNVTSTLLVPDPIRNDIATKSEMDLRSSSDLSLDIRPLDMTLDVKPIVLDLCYTVNIGKIPEVCVRSPYRHHVGLTLFGAEVLGMTFEGQQDMVVEEVTHGPVVVDGHEVSDRTSGVGRYRHDDGDGLHIRVDS